MMEGEMEVNKIVCSDMLDWLPTLPENSVDMVLIDPPYGTTACKWDSVIPLPEFWEALTRVAKPHAAIVVFSAQPFTSELIVSNRGMFRCEWIWDTKLVSNIWNSKTQPLRRHQNIIIFSQSKAMYYPRYKKTTNKSYGKSSKSMDYWHGQFDRENARESVGYPQSIIEFYRPSIISGETGGLHPTQKPVNLCEYLIKTYSQPGELVLDPTCGSGTTFVAARKCGRDYIGCDSSEEYVEVARDRLQRTDPYQDRPVSNGEVQLSLFG